MSFLVIIEPLAEQDLVEAQVWYEEKRVGLGVRFRSCVNEALGILSQTPFIYPVLHRGIRRAPVRKFPYLIYFLVQNDKIFVFGCFHGRRDPRLVLARARGH